MAAAKKKTKKKKVAKKKAARGRPKYEPTEKDRKQVKALVGYGVKHEDIAKVIYNPATGEGISKQTLHNYYKKELGEGSVIANGKVAQSLYNKALGGGQGSTAAAIFWLKARAGWSETYKHEVATGTGVLVVPATKTVKDWVAEQQELNKGRVAPE